MKDITINKDKLMQAYKAAENFIRDFFNVI